MKTTVFVALFFLFIVYLASSCERKEIHETYGNGNLKRVCRLSNGLRNGLCTSYYENGSKASVNTYVNDTLHGNSVYFHRNGTLNCEVHFEHGQKSGVVHYYDSLGKRYQTSTFLYGRLEGPSYSYYPTGIVKMKITYHRNRREGYYVFFDETGKIKRKETYSADRRIDVTEYDSLGNKGDEFNKEYDDIRQQR
jgi:antitoxin component YwqK of YwqJK toxin-antitoxin module